MNHYKKTIGLVILILSFFPALAGARFMITTELVWGQIISIEDKSIELENGVVYHPADEYMELDITAGDTVTLEVYIDRKGKQLYLKFALGEDSLPMRPLPEPVRGNKNY